MAKQELVLYTDKRADGYYSFIQYPQEEGGSLETAGPFETEAEAREKLENGIALLKAIMPDRIRSIHRIQ